MKDPVQYELSDYVRIDAERLAAVSDWIIDHAIEREITHSGISTNLDDSQSRPTSVIRKVPLLYATGVRPPEGWNTNTAIGTLLALIEPTLPPLEVQETVLEIYEALRKPAEEYFGIGRLATVQTEHAAVGHVYFPGSTAGESHSDKAPTVPLCLTCPKDLGALWIAKNGNVKGRENIRREGSSWKILPRLGTFVLFNGTRHSHVADGLPVSARGPRVGVNFTYRPMKVAKPADFTKHPRNYLLDPSLFE